MVVKQPPTRGGHDEKVDSTLDDCVFGGQYSDSRSGGTCGPENTRRIEHHGAAYPGRIAAGAPIGGRATARIKSGRFGYPSRVTSGAPASLRTAAGAGQEPAVRGSDDVGSQLLSHSLGGPSWRRLSHENRDIRLGGTPTGGGRLRHDRAGGLDVADQRARREAGRNNFICTQVRRNNRAEGTVGYTFRACEYGHRPSSTTPACDTGSDLARDIARAIGLRRRRLRTDRSDGGLPVIARHFEGGCRLTTVRVGRGDVQAWRRTVAVAVVLSAALLASGCAAGRAFRQGAEAARDGQWDAAVEYYRRAMADDPDRPEYRIALERAMLEASRAHAAAAAARERRRRGRRRPSRRCASRRGGRCSRRCWIRRRTSR